MSFTPQLGATPVVAVTFGTAATDEIVKLTGKELQLVPTIRTRTGQVFAAKLKKIGLLWQVVPSMLYSQVAPTGLETVIGPNGLVHEGVAVIETAITGIALTVIVLEAVKLQVVVVVVTYAISSMAKSFPP